MLRSGAPADCRTRRAQALPGPSEACRHAQVCGEPCSVVRVVIRQAQSAAAERDRCGPLSRACGSLPPAARPQDQATGAARLAAVQGLDAAPSAVLVRLDVVLQRHSAALACGALGGCTGCGLSGPPLSARNAVSGLLGSFWEGGRSRHAEGNASLRTAPQPAAPHPLTPKQMESP